MSRLWAIAVREYLENVKTKAFLIAICMTPLLIGLSFLIPMMLEKSKPETRHIAIADLTGVLGDAVSKKLADRKNPGDQSPLYALESIDVGSAEGPADPAAREAKFLLKRGDLDRRVLDGDLFAYVVLRPSALERTPSAAPSEYRAGNLFDHRVFEDVRSDVAEVVNARVAASASVPEAAARVLTTRVPMETTDVRAKGKGGSVASNIMPIAFMMLLFLTIVSVSQALITSTLEEKGNRVVEVLLSSVSPFELMAGKVFGTCAVGLTLMAIWAAGGIAGLAMNGIHVVEAGQMGLCVLYYLLGFLLVASLMVAVGSACNTLKEAQNLLAPVMFLLTLPMFFVLVVARDPNGTLSTILSMFPPFTPFLMMMRVGSTPAPPAWQIAASLVLLAGSAWLALRLAARVFRVGVLLYGKPPTMREIFRWMRSGGSA